MKRYHIEVTGFESYVIEAETASKARYRAYCDYCDGWNRIPFLQFCYRVHVQRII